MEFAAMVKHRILNVKIMIVDEHVMMLKIIKLPQPQNLIMRKKTCMPIS